MRSLVLDGGLHPYPDTAIDLAKVLCERDVEVDFEDERSTRGYVTHNAADVWLPILQITASVVMLNVGTNLLSSWIENLLGRKEARAALLHIEWEIVDGDKRESFRADGLGKDVLDGLDAFERRLRDNRRPPSIEDGSPELRKGDDGFSGTGERTRSSMKNCEPH